MDIKIINDETEIPTGELFIDDVHIMCSSIEMIESLKGHIETALKGYIKESDIDEYEIYKKWANCKSDNFDDLNWLNTIDGSGHVKNEPQFKADMMRFLNEPPTPEPLTPDDSIKSEMSELRDLIGNAPKDRVIEIMGFVQRLESLERSLQPKVSDLTPKEITRLRAMLDDKKEYNQADHFSHPAPFEPAMLGEKKCND